MLVVALCDHFTDQYRTEGEEFEHSGPLYEHIKPVNPKQKRSRKLDEEDSEES